MEKNSQRGFTLIELAIVLVIIGIILGAVIKGQDLIQNARAKKVVSKFKEWEIAQWNFYDRKGYFAGDGGDKNGLIGNDTNDDVKSDLTGASFINPPYEGSGSSATNTITVGSYKYYVYFGNDGSKNVMVLCKNASCDSAFSGEDLLFIDAIDRAIDGVADGTSGNVICAGTPNNIDTDDWEATFNSAPSASACSTSSASLVYYFDAKP